MFKGSRCNRAEVGGKLSARAEASGATLEIRDDATQNYSKHAASLFTFNIHSTSSRQENREL